MTQHSTTWSNRSDSQTVQRLLADASRLWVDAGPEHEWLRRRHEGWWDHTNQVWVVPVPGRHRRLVRLLGELERTRLKYRPAQRPLRDRAVRSADPLATAHAGTGRPVPQIDAHGVASHAQMLSMVQACPAATVQGRRDRALVLACWELMATPAHLQALDVGDLRPHSEGLEVQVTGQLAVMAYRADPEHCPVRALTTYLELREEVQLLRGPVWLRTAPRRGHTDILTAQPMSSSEIAARLNAIAVDAGLSGRRTALGLRQGAIATAAASGASQRWLAAQSRHAPDCAFLNRLIRLGQRAVGREHVDLWGERPRDRRAR
ncbi:hypothetical protein NE857_21895 [Nocardiopsis exhalans]|uniref:Integrase n=1 Tax=Nocardiopsis exhalans TaxID=163604 RepID=A0ABY5D0X1_9ACTN|nr:hypothetical protein [Nocardiopsis exhalans]USY17971.1 hypothetical protein NE857_21895 [Nocardiopsis exhalans]